MGTLAAIFEIIYRFVSLIGSMYLTENFAGNISFNYIITDKNGDMNCIAYGTVVNTTILK
jgi:hypothetical protein